eukprot:174659-Pelagomonas_calceolata.AAC.2
MDDMKLPFSFEATVVKPQRLVPHVVRHATGILHMPQGLGHMWCDMPQGLFPHAGISVEWLTAEDAVGSLWLSAAGAVRALNGQLTHPATHHASTFA